jgi:hypothetical protein
MIEPEEKDDKPSQDETSKTSVQTDNSSSQATIDASAPSEQTIDDPTPPMLEKNSDAPASPQTSPLENIMPAPRIEPVKDATASIHEWRKSTQKIDKSKEARGKKAPSAAAPKRNRKKRGQYCRVEKEKEEKMMRLWPFSANKRIILMFYRITVTSP